MKKFLSILLVFVSALVLVSCKDDKDIDTNSPVLFSKLMTEPFYLVSGIELYNPSENEVDLKGHSIEIYSSSSKVVETKIELKGKIASKGFFFIVDNDAVSEALEKANQTYTGKLLSGSEAIRLISGKKQIDIIGTVGSASSYINQSTGATYVRKPERLIQREQFMITDYIEFLPELYEMLGKTEIGLTDEDFMYGPRLTASDRALSFYDGSNKLIGGGGVAKVTVSGYGDGDTSNIKYPTELGVTGRTRYQFVDTPETQVGRIEVFGYAAAQFTNNLLKEAQDFGYNIEVQTPKGLSTDGGSRRFFGHVYVDGYSVSYLLLRQGLARLTSTTSSSSESETNYKNMNLESWMRQADYYAMDNKLGSYGTLEDPSHFYNGTNDARNVGYRPFFVKPYERVGVEVVTTEVELKDALLDNKTRVIEVANDIKLTDTLVYDSATLEKRIVGFGNKLVLEDKTKPVLKLSETTLYLENIGFVGGNNSILADNSKLYLNGFISFETEGEAISLVNGSIFEQKTNTTDYIKDAFNIKFAFDTKKVFIKADETSTVVIPKLIFKGQKVSQVLGTQTWNLEITKP